MNTYTDEQLNAFIDEQLDNNTCARLLKDMQEDHELAERINQLQYSKDMLRLAYSDLPQPACQMPVKKSELNWFSAGIAASILFVLSVGAGWFGHTQLSAPSNAPSFGSLAQFNPAKDKNERILLHISSKDEKRILNVLDTTERLLTERENSHRPVQLEIVANAEGIAMLREGSPYQQRIHAITMQHRNVSFYACGHAMENARLKEGKEVQLIPEANKVNAALEQIIKRLKLGWAYIRA
jgi:intracellular sulfur oxidation DsrE/DsrF family protein